MPKYCLIISVSAFKVQNCGVDGFSGQMQGFRQVTKVGLIFVMNSLAGLARSKLLLIQTNKRFAAKGG